MIFIYRHTSPIGVVMLLASVWVLLFHKPAAKIIAAAAFALLALDRHKKATGYPEDSKVRRAFLQRH